MKAYLQAHSDTFRVERRWSFRQVYLNADRRGAAAEAQARALRERLAGARPDVAIDGLGDAVMLPAEVPRSTRAEVARQFGDEFADALLAAGLGQWTGPIRSGYGLHVVLVRERTDARLPALSEVRAQVEREFTADRRTRQLDAMYREFLSRYRVVVERPQEPAR